MKDSKQPQLIVKMYLFPSYVSLESIEYFSKQLFQILKELDVEIQEERWDGTLESIPKGEPVIVRASTKQTCSDTDLAKLCYERGHLSFYDDRYQLPSGNYESAEWREKVESFLEKAKGSALPNDMLIAYLRSTSKNRSTLGEGTHMRRKASLLFRLFKKHVMDDNIPRDPTVFNTSYAFSSIPETKKEGSKVMEQYRAGKIAVNALREEIHADKETLAAMGISPLAEDARAKAYRIKMENGLEYVLFLLMEATDLTQTMYEANKSPFDAAVRGIDPHPVGTFMATFASRRETNTVAQAMSILFDAALPLVIEKLTAAGYPDSNEVIEWEYT